MGIDLGRRFVGVVLLLLLLTAFVSAVTFEPLSIASLASKAELVVQGVVQSKTCQRDSSGRIYTRVELRPTDLWKGSISSSPILIVHGGGILGEKESVVSGQVTYEVGEEVVAFLIRNRRGECVTIGLMQGKFQIWKDAHSGMKFVVSPFYGIPQSASSRVGTLRTPSSDSLPSALSLDDLKKRVLETRP